MDAGSESGWIIERLGALHMTSAEREAAKSYLRQGAFLANLTIPAIALIRTTWARVARGLREPIRFSH